MNYRYYKQADPSTPLYLSNGQSLVFPRVDHLTGHLATKDKFLIEEINTAINKGIGGVSVSTKEEYGEYLKKKSSGAVAERRWRDEIKPQMSSDPGQSPHQVVPPAEGPESGEAPVEKAPAPKKRVGKFKKKK